MQEDLENLSHLNTDPGEFPYTRGIKQQNDWNISENITAPSIKESNRCAREAVEMGADSLYIYLEAAPNEGMLGGDIRGVPLQEQKNMKNLLEGIDLKSVSVHFDGGIVTPLIYCMYMNEIERQKLNPADVNASFYYDPFTWGAAHGRWPNSEEKTGEIISGLCNLPFRSLGINGTFYRNCGATIVQELGSALSIGSEFLAYAAKHDIPISEAARSIHMRLSAGPLYFPEIAKFRAARLLWSKIVSAYDPDATREAKLIIQAETSSWNKTITDPHTNILRTTTEAMSAIIGGADSVRIGPFDSRFRQPSSHARRIARNIHHILRNEAYFHRVTDPSAGSYYIEQLTDKIASGSWDFFRFLEKQGGFSKALEGRFLQLAVDESVRKKQSKIRTGERIFVGGNQYPNPDDQFPDQMFRDYPVQSLEQTGKVSLNNGHLSDIKKAFTDNAKIGDAAEAVFRVQKQLYPSLEPWHATAPFESLRIRTVQYQKIKGTVPLVTLLAIGNKKESTIRADFSANYFGVAGYETRKSTGYDSIDEAANEIKSIKPEIIVLCSSDKDYRELVEPFCKVFREIKESKPILILAGLPEESLQDYRQSGIDYFIYKGSDVYETLNVIHGKLEEKLR